MEAVAGSGDAPEERELMKSKQPFLFSVACLTCLAGLAQAHHSRGNFDLDDVLELNGVVTEYTWRNPHTFVTLDVENDAGEAEEWLLELNSIAVLTGTGWTRDTIQVGDRVTVFGNPDNDRSKKFFFSNYFVLPDGSRMVSAPNYSRGVPIQRPPARELDTTATSTDFTGIWRREGGMGGGMGMGGGAAGFGVGVGMGAIGGAAGAGMGADAGAAGAGMGAIGGATALAPPPAGPAIALGNQTPAMGLPVTARGQAELDDWDVRDNPWFRCEPRTLPGVIGGTQEILRPADDRITFRYEILDVERTVHLGLTGHPSDIEPSHLGHSIGWFEDESLVVDTALFTPADWGIGAGVPSSDLKHVVERYSLFDGGRRMQVEYTFEDPVFLTEQVTLSATFFVDPGYPWQEYGCDPNASSRHLDVE